MKFTVEELDALEAALAIRRSRIRVLKELDYWQSEVIRLGCMEVLSWYDKVFLTDRYFRNVRRQFAIDRSKVLKDWLLACHPESEVS